jgi:Uma2 family endonuclease
LVITIKFDPHTLVKNPEDNKICFRYSDIESVPEWPEGPLIELIDGDLYMVPSPNVNHQRISRRIESLLVLNLKQNPIAEMLGAPVDVILSEKNVVIPDIFCILNENRDIIKENNIQGTPDLIIEILSSDARKDTVLKKKLYQQYHVKEYWIVDPGEESIKAFIFNLAEGVFDNETKYPRGSTITSVVLQDFSFQVDALFQDEIDG